MFSPRAQLNSVICPIPSCVDLSEVQLTHYNLRNRGKQNLVLSGEDTPTLDSFTDAGSGSVHEKEKAWLSEIIEQLNVLFGSNTTEGDQLSYATRGRSSRS